MSPEHLAALAVFGFVSSITPGPNNLMLLASGLNYGIVRTVPHMLGVAGGFMLMLFAIGMGFGAVFALLPGAQTVIKALCAVYLLYLAYGMAKAGPVNGASGAGRGRPMRSYEAVAFQWVNPKAWAMALTAFSTYAQGDATMAALLIALVFGLVNAPCVAIWAVFGYGLRRVLGDPVKVKWFNRAMALLLVASVAPFLA